MTQPLAPIQTLPSDLILCIADMLPVKDRLALGRTFKLANSVIRKDLIRKYGNVVDTSFQHLIRIYNSQLTNILREIPTTEVIRKSAEKHPHTTVCFLYTFSNVLAISQTTLQVLLTNLKSLETLELHAAMKIEDAVFVNLLPLRLMKLSISRIECSLSETSINAIFKKCVFLESFEIKSQNWSDDLTDKLLQLEHLNTADIRTSTTKFTAVSLTALTKTQRKLKSITLSLTGEKFTEASVVQLIQSKTSLTYLSLNCTQMFTNATFRALAQSTPKLEGLYLNEVNSIDFEALRTLTELDCLDLITNNDTLTAQAEKKIKAGKKTGSYPKLRTFNDISI